MDAPRVGAALRAIRLRRRLRQSDLARLAGVSDPTVSRIERGRLGAVTLGKVESVARALDVRVDLRAWSSGADLDRLLNARHAALAEEMVRRLAALAGWEVRPEVSFGIYGERGVIDLLAWHGSTRTLLVIELKTAIVDVGELLGTLDRKRRLAPRVGARFGWQPMQVATWLVVADSMTNRRRVALHRATFDAALPDGGRRVRAWLQAADSSINALTFVTDRQQAGLRSAFAQPSPVPTRRRRQAPARTRSWDASRGGSRPRKPL